MNAIKELEREQLRTDVPDIAPGDTVRVSVKVVEGTRERIQVFEGTVMRMRGGGLNKAITVRRIASGVGVERTFMVHAPRIEKIEVVRHGVARRASADRSASLQELRSRRAVDRPVDASASGERRIGRVHEALIAALVGNLPLAFLDLPFGYIILAGDLGLTLNDNRCEAVD